MTQVIDTSSPLRRAWLRELGIERVWGATAPVPAVAMESATPVQATQPVAEPPPIPVRQMRREQSPVVPPPTVAEAPVPAAPAPVQDPDAAWAQLQAEVSTCTACALCQGRTQTVFGSGPRDAQWLVIGEGPGEQEDRQGKPFVGRSGQLLDNMLRAVGQTRDTVFVTNVVKCRPPRNRNPEPEEIAACRPFLERQLALLAPRQAMSVGKVSAQSLLGTDATIGSLRGRMHRVVLGEREVPLVVTYHPAYLLRAPLEKAKAWRDFKMAADNAAS